MTTTSHSEPLLSVPKFAGRVGVSPYTVRKWIKAGALTAIDINMGGKLPVYRIPEGQLEDILTRASISPDPDREEHPEKSGGSGDGVSGGSPNADGTEPARD